MNERHAILDAWRVLHDANQDAVLATVVHVTGSAYRRPGARMLILPDGRRIGSVSGGCLEGEISRKAWWFTESPQPVVRVYDTTSSEEAAWEFGLGCNGVVHVMLERTSSPAVREMLHFMHDRRSSGYVVATVVRGPLIGHRLLMDDRWHRCGGLTGSALETEVTRHCINAIREQCSRLVHDGDAEIFVEWCPPQTSLVIFGAGHDVIPLVAFAKELGWRVTVADGRPAYATRRRFPSADEIVLLPAQVRVDSDSVVVMTTHNYPLDARLLPGILAAQPRYLGLLGPRSRAQRLFEDLGLDQPAYVHAPTGLDLGCDSPAAVALSIVAEIQASLSNRSGGPLRHRTFPIHPPSIEIGTSAALHLESARPAFCETMVGSNV